jgi:hypothetical protein
VGLKGERSQNEGDTATGFTVLTFALFLEGWWVAKEADRRDEECAEAENRKHDAFDKYRAG